MIDRFDIFEKYSDDYSKKLNSGGIISIIFVISSFLIIMMNHGYSCNLEYDEFFNPLSDDRIIQDNLAPLIPIFFDIRFFHIPCSLLSVSVEDFNSDPIIHGKVRTKMQRYDKNSTPVLESIYSSSNLSYCGDCYELKSGCCTSCKEVKHLFKSNNVSMPPTFLIKQCYKPMFNESCRIHGSINIYPHPSILRIGMNSIRTGENIKNYNISFKINHFSIRRRNSNMFNPKEYHIGSHEFTFLTRIFKNSVSYITYPSLRASSNTIMFHFDFWPFRMNQQFNKVNLLSLGGLYSFFTLVDIYISNLSKEEFKIE